MKNEQIQKKETTYATMNATIQFATFLHTSCSLTSTYHIQHTGSHTILRDSPLSHTCTVMLHMSGNEWPDLMESERYIPKVNSEGN